MQISLNGKAQTLDENTSLQQLLESLNLEDKRLAVEINGDIVPKSQHNSQQLNDGDNIEIVQAIGGGQDPIIKLTNHFK